MSSQDLSQNDPGSELDLSKSSMIARSVSSKLGPRDVLSAIAADLSGDQLASLLLEALEQRAAGVAPAAVMQAYLDTPLARPSRISPLQFLKVEALLAQCVPADFDWIEHSPVSPFALTKALSGSSQRKVLGTIRNVEVLADATSALTLEVAERRRRLLKADGRDNTLVNVCSNSRCLRLQQFKDQSGFVPHFKVFAACSGGRDAGHESFEIETLNSHIRLYLNLAGALRQAGFHVGDVKVALSDMRVLEMLIEKKGLSRSATMQRTQDPAFSPLAACGAGLPPAVHSMAEVAESCFSGTDMAGSLFVLRKLEPALLKPLREDFPGVEFVFDFDRKAGIGYYPWLCFKISYTNKQGQSIALIDGGFTDWTGKLVASRKERLLTSGFGTEHFLSCFQG